MAIHVVGAGRRAGDRIKVAVDLEGIIVHQNGRATVRWLDRVYLYGEEIRADRRHSGIDPCARDHGEDDADIVVVNQVGITVGGYERVLRRFGQIGNSLDPECCLVDVESNAGDWINKELVSIDEFGRNRVVAAAVESKRDARDAIGERDLSARHGGRKTTGRMTIVAHACRADRVGHRNTGVQTLNCFAPVL